ncbi:hypothetical protein [Cryobacterium cryoconiti]|uniref:Uncharacterized protein n=1 Tax=Cryobacterium cryoconiti TaxID=1259239 RepID=A0A4Y8JU15_9MICO|nr:hypothetical protein [Cryobacterium cryoconiti]TFD27487.1 hypothetical protein E3T49_13160 [Cryobacterium cryoconiti]
MARIRTIKPDFWTDGNMIGLTPFARLLYIGSWNFTLCDRGHLSDDAQGLRLKVLPGDMVDGEALLQELMDKGRIVRVVLPDDRTFLHIPRFEDHQKLDTRWNSRCPACVHGDSLKLSETQASLGETPGNSPRPDGTRLGGEGKGKERKGGEGTVLIAAPTPFCKNHPDGTDSPCRACGNARHSFEAHLTAVKNKPTVPGMVTEPDCAVHPGRPKRGCDRCAETAAA